MDKKIKELFEESKCSTCFELKKDKNITIKCLSPTIVKECGCEKSGLFTQLTTLLLLNDIDYSVNENLDIIIEL